MLTRKIVRALAGSTLVAASLLGAAGCGGLGPGDYVTYRIASENEVQSASCYQYGVIPPDVEDDSTSFKSGSTFILYVAGDEEALLDTGDLVLPGSIEDDPYNFSGRVTNIEYVGGGLVIDADHDGIPDEEDEEVDADHDGLDDHFEDDFVDVDNDGFDDRLADNLVDVDNNGVDDRVTEVVSDAKVTTTTAAAVEMTVDGSTTTGTLTTRYSQTCEGINCPQLEPPCTIKTDFRGVEIEETDPAFGSGSNQ